MINKQDKSTPRKIGDIESQYGKTIKETKKEVESQRVDLTSIETKLKQLYKDIVTINTKIQEINKNYINVGEKLTELDEKVLKNTELRHGHENKSILDEITENDINNWNDKFTGKYNLLANSITVNQTVDGISSYNLILIRLENINAYIPCFKYENNFCGSITILENEQSAVYSANIEISENTITTIKSTNSIVEIIGVF